MDKNEDYYKLKDIIERIAECMNDKHSSLAFFGSANYGLQTKSENQLIKPNKSSDLDLILVCEELLSLDKLEKYLEISKIGRNLFDNKYVDMFVIRGKLDNRKISLHCVKLEVYKNLCDINSKKFFITQHKRLITKKTLSSFYEYKVYCDKCEHKQYSRIIPIDDGHLIVYPIVNQVEGHFCLTVFQDQILTQNEIVDSKGFLKSERERLQQSINSEIINKNINPLDYFKLTRSYWDLSFENFMKSRLYKS